jgi:ELWxxDGT repeat protein
MNGVLYFQANNSTNGAELWKSNGTALGTVMVKDLVTGSASSTPSNIVVVNSSLYFSATTSSTGQELFTSDGTNITLVKDISLGGASSDPIWIRAVENNIVFFAADGINGSDMWRSDGTEGGTLRIFDNRKQLNNAANANPMFQMIGNKLAFFTWALNDPGPSLWVF